MNIIKKNQVKMINPNQSRVLNFVFRQLLQEYITIMYLSNVKIGFSNGHPESQVIVPIEKLDELLATYVKPAFIDKMREQIIFEYLTVTNYKGINKAFLKKITKPAYPNTTVEFYTKDKDLVDTYPLSTGGNISVPGVILSVEKNILFTDSVIVDALLGQGEALDCFNAKIQEAFAEKDTIANNSKKLENDKLSLGLKIIETIEDPVLRAEAYAKMFNPVPPQNIIQ